MRAWQDFEGQRVYRILGIIAGACSLTTLLWEGFRFTSEPFFVQLLQIYEGEMQLAFGMVEPWITEAVDWLGIQFGSQLHLYPHWKHLFVLMWLYFESIAKVRSAERSELVSALLPRRAVSGIWIQGSQIELALVRAFWSLIIALLFAVAAGTIDLNGAKAIWVIPVFALVAYVLIFAGIDAYLATQEAPLVGGTWTARFWHLHRAVTSRLLIGAMFVGLCIQASRLALLRGVPNASLVVLFALLLLQAFLTLGRGSWSGQGLRGQPTRRGRIRGSRMAVPQVSVIFADSPRRRRAAERRYFNRSVDREAEPSTDVTPRAGQLFSLHDVQIELLLPGALIVLGTLVLVALAFW